MTKREYVVVEEVLSDAELKTARSKYSFDFAVDGVASRTWYDPNTGQTYLGSKGSADMLGDLAAKIEHVIHESQSKSDVDELDIRNFASTCRQ
jgi:hypothetical protein